MAKVKLSENLFMEVAELNRYRQFIEKDGWKRAFKSIIKSYGIVEDANNTYFKVTKNTDRANTVIINSGIAFDNNMDAIVNHENIVFPAANEAAFSQQPVGTKTWLILSRDVHNFEEGTVSITADGTLIGLGTKFTEVLRGQPNFPTKIKFESVVNNSEYEVIQVNGDGSAIISGAVTPESNLRYAVMGTFTPGFSPLEENKLIYEFDSFKIETINSAGKPALNDNQFIIASLSWDELGNMSVSDERISYMFNSDYNVNENTAEGINPLTSLLQATIVSGINSVNAVSADIEMILEHGYSITSYNLSITESANIFNIISGSCNYLGISQIPNNLVRGWLLVNRANMKSAKITKNVGNALYLESVDDELELTADNDFVIVPDFKEVEFEVKLNSNVAMPAKPFNFRQSISNPFTRARVYATFPKYGGAENVTVSIRYRMIDNLGTLYPYKELATANFINTQGNTETLANSSFTVNMKNIEPAANQRNYS